MTEIPIIQYSSDFKISFGLLDFTVGANGALGLENYRSDSAAAVSMARSPSSSDMIPALVPLGSEEEDPSFGNDSKSDRSFDEDSVRSTYPYPHTINMVDIVDPTDGDKDGDQDGEQEGNPVDGRPNQLAEGGRQEENPPVNDLSVGHHRRPRGSRGSRNARRLDLGPDLEVDGVKVHHTPQRYITEAKTLLYTLMVDANYQSPAMQKPVAMLKAAAAQEALRQSPTPTDDEIDGIKAYIPRLRIVRWPKGFKPVPIEKYDGQTNPREWLQLYNTTIRSTGGDSYVMANYLPVCLDPAVRIWLTSLPKESITSCGDPNKKLRESFQAICNRPGNHFDLSWIKQKTNEPLHDYIKRFCTKKTKIPNVPDQQIIAAFQGGIRSDDLVRGIGRRNHDLKLTAQECFEITDKFASGESALDDIRGKGKEKRPDKPESSKKDKKRNSDNVVHTVDRLQKKSQTNEPSMDELLSGLCLWHPKGNHKAKDSYRLKEL
ncbi:hypothetical protein PR202_gb12935 [Eleusine coracana subsp. coracana]|uniref:Retrotransposon gag domain-containing protein n=1 Tax=Eleusine coracana subsp. coracana TaxID=191504 RepID=A0AAV5ERK2_ELECO|nr:hypothetical protein PR202_gb12935 [Eleusine coracana subsp. coracana]